LSLFFCYTIYTDGNNFITVSKTSEESRILSKNLYTNKFFKGLDRDVHDTIHSVMHRHSFIAGEKMFTKEDMFFCIVAGSCHVVQQGIGAVVDLVSKGKSFGMFLFFFLQYIARYSRQYIARYSRLGILGSVFSHYNNTVPSNISPYSISLYTSFFMDSFISLFCLTHTHTHTKQVFIF